MQHFRLGEVHCKCLITLVQAEVKLVRALAGPLEQLQNTALHIGQLQVRNVTQRDVPLNVLAEMRCMLLLRSTCL